MSIDIENIDAVIAQTEEEIDRLTRAVAALKEAAAFLSSRSAPSLLGAGKREQPEGHQVRKSRRPDAKAAPTSGDLAGLLLTQVAERILEDAEDEEGLSADEITRRAIAGGYRSTSFRNPTNDPRKIAKSIRVTLSKLSETFEVKAGKIRLKK